MIWALLLITLYVLICFYIGWLACQWLRLFLPQWCNVLFWVLYLPVAASLFLERLVPMRGTGRLVGHVRNHWLGFLAYTLVIILILDLIRLVCSLCRRILKRKKTTARTDKRRGLLTGAVVLVLITAIGLYGSWNARQIRSVSLEIQIDKPALPENLRVVLAADLHLGLDMDAARLKPFVAAVNALEPDLILLAGDLFDGDYASLADPQAAAAELRCLETGYGVFACLGNHDAGDDLAKMLLFLDTAGIRVLADKSVLIGDIVMAGRLDRAPIGAQGNRQTLEQVLAAADRSKPVILMDHSPLGIAEVKDSPVDLLVSGHTHNGQIFPGNLIVQAIYENGYGYRRFGDLHTVVTSGIGTWGPPWRIASHAEIVAIEIQCTG